jgi:two-component system KDP operon response regulator KdpE
MEMGKLKQWVRLQHEIFVQGIFFVPMRIVIIDDDIDMTEMVCNLLPEDEFEAFSANQSSEGIELIKSVSPDIVILDMMMPDRGGLEICQEIRQFSHVPILVLSAVSTPGISARILDIGADDFLEKPMNPIVLLAHLRKLARRSKSTNSYKDAPGHNSIVV